MSDNEKNNNFFSSLVKGIGLSIIISLVCVLIFGFVIKSFLLPNGTIKVVNQFIKVLSIFIGVFSCSGKNLGLVKGCLVGAFSIIITHLIFSLIGGNISFGLSFIIDVLFGLIVGGISGTISVNMKRE